MSTMIYLSTGGAIGAMAIAVWTHFKTPEPVAVNTQITAIERFEDRVEIMLEWENARHCEFSSLSVVQGSYSFPDQYREALDRDLGPPKGPRGKGKQRTVKPWVFYRPDSVQGPEVIMTAWHRCGNEAVPSTMLVRDIRDWFPE